MMTHCIVWRVYEGQSEQETGIHGLSSTSRCNSPSWDSAHHPLCPTAIKEYSTNNHHAAMAASGEGACDAAHWESEGGCTSPAYWEHRILFETCSWRPHKGDRQASSDIHVCYRYRMCISSPNTLIADMGYVPYTVHVLYYMYNSVIHVHGVQ